MNREGFKRSELPELTETSFENWAEVESLKLAREVAYDQGNLNGSPEESSAPALPSAYRAEITPIAERRAMLAGYRLADILRDLFD